MVHFLRTLAAQVESAAHGMHGGSSICDQVRPVTHDVANRHASGLDTNDPELHVLRREAHKPWHQPQPEEAQGWQVFDAAHGSGHLLTSASGSSGKVP